jgi:predicted AAA+ superfamily ATPase
MITRAITETIQTRLFKKKVVIILGARQVGKTTILKDIATRYADDSMYLNCDEPDIADRLTGKTSTQLHNYLGAKKLILIDEAQRVRNIGITLKLMADNYPDQQLIVSGSSALELANNINEPLTGRKFEYVIYPLSVKEVYNSYGQLEAGRLLEQQMIYGMYPEIVTNPADANALLKNLISSYLFKDLFTWNSLKKPELLMQLLKALALQIGKEVSYNELSNMLGVAKETIVSYIQLLEKTFVIFRLPSFNRNLRIELTRKQKIYFFDNGVRNALLNNFNPLSMRSDVGALWENFMVMERCKQNMYNETLPNMYFWRTHQQQEIDFIEEVGGTLSAFEFKWKNRKAGHAPKLFTDTYIDSNFKIINSDNFYEFVGINQEV